MPKKGDRSILYVRRLPSGLLGRINGLAENLDLVRDEFVIKLLELSVRRFEKTQQEMKQWWKTLLEQDEKNDENRQGPIRRSPPPDAGKATAKNLRHTRKERT